MTALRRILGALCLVACARAGAAELVIVDNDWTASASSSLLPLLAAPGIEVLGLTTVTGDAWRDQGRRELGAFLAAVGKPAIPVVSGALMPLHNTRARMLAWETVHGTIPWKGAWNDATPPAVAAPAGEDAADFMVRQVRAHPQQVTIYAAGPLTNVALALQREPRFATLARQLVFTGANLTQIKANGRVKSDFNFLFDPEAADIVLRAGWARITSLGDAADDAVLTPQLRRRLLAQSTAGARHLAANNPDGSTQWDLLGAVIVADPSVVTGTLDVKMAVDLDGGLFHGRARAWLNENAPASAGAPVTVVRSVDLARFADDVVASAHAPLP